MNKARIKQKVSCIFCKWPWVNAYNFSYQLIIPYYTYFQVRVDSVKFIFRSWGLNSGPLFALPLVPHLLFCFSYFSGRGSCFLPGAGLREHPPIYASHITGITDTYHFICWDEVSLTFYLRQLQTVILWNCLLSSWNYKHVPPYLATGRGSLVWISKTWILWDLSLL
jgi:hypothetical protein